MTILPQCFQCRHLYPGVKPMACAAFVGGIPEAILMADHDHREPYAGDHGIRFEPIEAKGTEPRT